MKIFLRVFAFWLAVIRPLSVSAQHEHHHASTPVEIIEHLPGSAGSGTSLEPRSTPSPMLHWTLGEKRDWTLMTHSQGFAVFTHETGPQGVAGIFSTNWGMASLGRAVKNGNLSFRTMLSLEPATVTGRQYPLLFQAGETAFGKRLVNGQHPHDFVMELAARYARSIGENTTLVFYNALVGDPALGPVAFPHSLTASEMPEAIRTHHKIDSTHISRSVFTAGVFQKHWGVEASVFNGQEPDEQRWNIDLKKPDSWSMRYTFSPGQNWLAQISHGLLKEPEEHEPGNIVRTTASATYTKPIPNGYIAINAAWGRNRNTTSGAVGNGYLAGFLAQFRKRNYISGRLEHFDQEGLLPGEEHDSGQHRVTALTIGASRDIIIERWYRIAAGFDISTHRVPQDLHTTYGKHPVGIRTFLRWRLGE